MVSIAIVTRAMSGDVEKLAARAVSMASGPAEIVVVAESSTAADPASRRSAGDRTFLVMIPAGRGLAYNRNRAVEACSGETVVFLDDDCWPDDDWLARLLEPLEDSAIGAVMGNVRIAPSTFLGDSISALGFPGGGSAGFAVMFNVEADGTTDHLSTLNCAIRRAVIDSVGGFDESMTAGSEDTELSYRIRAAGHRIAFAEMAVVEHQARADLGEFARWFFRRGRGAFQLSQRAPVGGIVGHRLSSYGRIVGSHLADAHIVAIVPLLAASVVLQGVGFVWEAAFGPRASVPRR